ncbi:outer membrane protein assembly factor BamB family protein [Streptomyces sp. NPDC055036]
MNLDAKELLRVPAPEVTDNDDRVSSEGSWVTSEYYVSGAPDALQAYHVASGKPAWTVPLSGNLCQASRTATSTGKVAVSFAGTKDKRSRCTEFGVIDINQGKMLWQKSIPRDQVYLGLGLSVAISDDIAAAGWPEGSVGYQTSTGKQLWDAPQGCGGEEHLDGQQVLTLVGCATTQGPQYRVERRSPETGEATWHYRLPDGTVSAWMVSAGDPLVLAVRTNEDVLDADRLLTVSSDGEVLASIDIGADWVAGCDANNGVCGGIVVAHDRIYLGSDPHTVARGNEITGFDIRTGKRVWSAPAQLKRTLIPLRSDKDGLIAYMKPRIPAGGSVLRIAPDGKQETLLRMPDGFDLAEDDSPLVREDMENPVLFDGRRVYFHYSGPFYPGGNAALMTLVYGIG